MKRMMFWSLMMLVVTMPLLAACGSNDEEGSNITPSSPSNKRVTKIVEEKRNSITKRNFSYDAKGRVIEMKTTLNSGSTTNKIRKRTYQYGETLIIVNEVEIVNNTTNNTHYSYTYNLSDGKIVRKTQNETGNSVTYTYDSNGYMQKSDNSTEYDHIFNWSDGNLTSISVSVLDYTESSFEYTNEVWKLGTFFDVESEIVSNGLTGIDPVLIATGYFGKIPRNLPDKWESYDGILKISYKYTMSGGLLTIVEKQYDSLTSIQGQNINYSYNSVIFITWE